MPISDEIIELEPVKKSKNKLIIMFVIMGVLLAAAVTFFVLYLLKPAPKEVSGEINDVVPSEEVDRTYSLFNSVNGDTTELRAIAGTEYKVGVTVSANGDVDPGVHWLVEPKDAITIIGYEEDGNKYYCIFTPNPAYMRSVADGSADVVLTAASLTNPDKVTRFEFKVVNQGTADIRFNKIWRINNDTNISDIGSDNNIVIPFYAGLSQDTLTSTKYEPSYYITFDQLGEWDPVNKKRSEITVNTIDGRKTNEVTAVSTNEDILVIESVAYDAENPYIKFKLKGVGTAEIILSANVSPSSYAPKLDKKLTIVSESFQQREFIGEISASAVPFDANYFAQHPTYSKITDKTPLTLVYNSTYDYILSHVLLNPIVKQYKENKLRTDWYKDIQITSSNTDVLTVMRDKTTGDCTLTTQKKTGYTDLTFTDVMPNGLCSSATLRVYVVATQSRQGTATVTTPDKKTYQSNETIATSQNVSTVLTVKFTMKAPEDTDTTTLIKNNVLSSHFALTSSSPNAFTAQLCEAGSTTKVSKEVKLGEQNTFTDDTVLVEKDKSSPDVFNITANFIITTAKNLNEGQYTLTFTRYGTEIDGKAFGLSGTDLEKFNNRINQDKTWDIALKYNVITNATTANFIDKDSAIALVTENYSKAGNFEITSNSVLNGVRTAVAHVYVQNRMAGAFGFNPIDLVQMDGRDNRSLALYSENESIRQGANASGIEFTGRVPSRDDPAVVIVSATDSFGKEIGHFEINIHIVNAVEALILDNTKPEDNDFRAVHYDHNNKASISVDRLQKQFVYSARRNETFTPHDCNIFYKNTQLYGVWNDDHTEKTFSFEKDSDPLFVFNKSTVRALVDIYSYSYNHKFNNEQLNLSEIEVEYFPDESKLPGAPEASVRQTFKFYRYADDISMYTGSDYNKSVYDNLTKKDTALEEAYDKYIVNQGSEIKLYASPVVAIYNDAGDFVKNVITAKDDIAKNFLVEDVYFQAPQKLVDSLKNDGDKKIVGTAVPGLTLSYYNMTFTAPKVSGDVNDYDIVLCSKGKRDTFTLLVQNYSRPIQSIVFYKADAAGDKTNDELADGNTLEFGRRSTTDTSPYTQVFYMEVKYTNDGRTYSQFEPAVLTLPDYFTYTINTDASVIDGGTERGFVPDGKVDEVDECTWKIVITVKSGKEKSVTGSILCTPEFSDEINRNIKVNVCTGLDYIGLGLDNQTVIYSNTLPTDPQELNFSLDRGGVKSIKISLRYFGYAETTDLENGAPLYGNIKYSHQKSGNLGLKYTNITGMSVAAGYAAYDPYITITVSNENTRVINGESFVLEFTDSVSGRTITVPFTITVSTDIQSLALTGIGTTTGKVVTTTGVSSGEDAVQELPLFIDYNGRVSNKQPFNELIYDSRDGVKINILDSSRRKYTGSDLYIVYPAANDPSPVFKLGVKNTLYSGNFCLVAEYTTRAGVEQTSELSFTVNTTAKDIAFRPAIGSSATAIPYNTADEAELMFDTAQSAYVLVAGVYLASDTSRQNNISSEAITYELFNNLMCTADCTSADIDENGVITLKADPLSKGGYIYYRASYYDASRKQTLYLYRTLHYYAGVNDVKLKEDLGCVYDANSKTLTLYFVDNTHYTTIDISSYIKVSTAYTVDPISSAVSLTITSGSPGVLEATNAGLLTPKRAGEARVTVKAKYNGTDAPVCQEVSFVFTVKVLGIDALSFDGADNQLVNVAENGVATIMPSSSAFEYTGLTATLSYVADSATLNKLDPSVVDNSSINIDVKRNALTSSDYYTASNNKTFVVLAKVSYELDTDVALILSWAPASTPWEVYKDFTVKLTGSYTPSFDLYYTPDGGTETLIANGSSQHEIDENATYTLKFTLPTVLKDYDADDWTFVAADANSVISIGAINKDTGIASVTVTADQLGEIELTLTATAYDNTYTATKTYNFVCGDNLACEVHISTNGSVDYSGGTVIDNDHKISTLYIDFDENNSAPEHIITYVIDTSGVGGAIGDVEIHFYGDATAGNIVHTGNIYYRAFTVDKPTTLTIAGTVVVGSRTYHTEKYVLTLRAGRPTFSLSADRSTLSQASDGTFQTATVSLAQGDADNAHPFMGEYSVEYSLLSDVHATGVQTGNTYTVTPKRTNTVDQLVTIRAVITINSGAYKGEVYEKQLTVTIKAVVAPSFSFTTDTLTLDAVNKSTYQTATLTLSNIETKFTDNFTVAFSLVSDTYATITDNSDNTATLTPKANNEVDRVVTVRVDVSINSGAYNGDKYSFEKNITIKGTPLPTLCWTNAGEKLVTSGTIQLFDDTTFNGVVNSKVTYACTTVPATTDLTLSYTIVEDSASVLYNKSCTVTSNTGALNIPNAAEYKAGGKLTIRLTATVKSGLINAGKVIDAGQKVIALQPQGFAKTGANQIYVSAKQGVYDIRSAVEPYTGEGSDCVLSTDKYSVIFRPVAANDDYDVSNGNLIIKRNLDTSMRTSISLVADIIMSEGAYRGTRIENIPVTIGLRNFAISSNKQLSWNDSSKQYDPFALVSGWISTYIPAAPTGYSLEGIYITPLEDGNVINVSGNSTASPVITVNRYYNLVEDSTGATAKNLRVEMFVTYKNNTDNSIKLQYYAAGVIEVAPLNVSISTERDDSAFDFSITTQMATESDSVFVMKFKEENGLEITDFVLTMPDGQTTLTPVIVEPTASDKSYKVEFNSCSVSSDLGISGIQFDMKVGNISKHYDLPEVLVKAITSAEGAFNVTELTGEYASFGAQNDEITVISYWEPNGLNYYMSPKNFSLKYLSSNRPKSVTVTPVTTGGAEETSKSKTLGSGNNSFAILSYPYGTQYGKYKITVVLRANQLGLVSFSLQYTGKSDRNISGTPVTAVYIYDITSTVSCVFDANGGSFGGAHTLTQSKAHGETFVEPTGSDAPTNSGYVVEGWYTDKSCTTRYNFTTPVTRSITLYAKWEQNVYTVSLIDNKPAAADSDVSLAQTTIQVNYGSQYGAALVTPSCTGFVFDGWYTNAVGGSQVDASSYFMTANSSTVLYAHWTPLVYTVNFNADGGELDSFAVNKTVDCMSTYGILPTPSKTGYMFGGWYDSTDTSFENVITSTTKVSYLGDGVTSKNLKAKWTAEQYTVALDANGGALSAHTSSPLSLTFGSEYSGLPTVSINAPTRAGYVFLGWFTSAAGGAEVCNGDTVPDLGVDKTLLATGEVNITLYAHWIEQYTVSLDLNYVGAATATTIHVRADETYGTKLTVPEREGYSFEGWWTNKGTGGNYGNRVIASSYADPTITVLYARWENLLYTISFNANGGTIDPFSATKTVKCFDTYGTLPITTRAGYSFNGWKSGPTEYTSTTSVAFLGNGITTQTLTADWVKETYKIALDANGGALSASTTSPFEAEYGATYSRLPTDSINAPMRAGYVFLGWFTSATGGTEVRNGDSVPDLGVDKTLLATGEVNITLYAHWVEKYTVTLDLNYDGAPSASQIEVIKGGTYSTLTSPTRNGYTFNGWWTKAGAGGDYGDRVIASTYVSNAISTLYARWESNEYTVKFYLEDADVSNDVVYFAKTVRCAAAFGDLPVAYKAGYRFDGWKMGETVISNTSVVPTLTHGNVINITAAWTLEVYKVALDPNGGTHAAGTTSPITATFGNTYSALTSPTRTGYTFAGWYTSAAGGDLVKSVDTVGDLGEHKDDLTSGQVNATLYAHWTAISSTVTFKDGESTIIEKTVTYDSKYGSLPTLSKPGYTFGGWKIEDSSITANTTVTITENKDALAQWTQNVYKITFIQGDGETLSKGSSTMNETTHELGVTYAAVYPTLPTVTKTGYTFDGWFVGGAKIEAGDTVAITANSNATARWTVNTYVVTFKDGDNTVAEKSVTYAGTYGTLPTLSKPGYTFGGWKIGSNDIASTDTVAITENKDALAQWTQNVYKITFIQGDGETLSKGSSTMNETTHELGVTYAAVYPTLPTVTKTGYTFDGWYIGSVKIEADDTVAITANSDATAQWTINTYTVTLEYYDTVKYEVSVEHGADAFFLSIEPTRSGYVFYGWFNGTDKVTSIPTITEDVTYTAKWIQIPAGNDSAVILFNDGYVIFEAEGFETIQTGWDSGTTFDALQIYDASGNYYFEVFPGLNMDGNLYRVNCDAADVTKIIVSFLVHKPGNVEERPETVGGGVEVELKSGMVYTITCTGWGDGGKFNMTVSQGTDITPVSLVTA